MRYFAGLVLLLFWFSSCKKNNDNDPPSSPRVKSLSIKWVNSTPQFDNISFFYDSDDRVTQILGHHGLADQPVAATDTIFRFVFLYSGADELPSLTIFSGSYSSGVPADYVFNYLFYDGQRRVTRDSMYFPNSATGVTKVLHYTYTTDYTLAENRLGGIDTLRISSGNYDSFSSPGHTPADPVLTRYAEFDNGFNPLNYLNISSIYHVVNGSKDPNLSEWSVWTLSNKNNITKEWFNSSRTDPPSSTMEYKYDTHGLPVYRVWRSGLLLDVTDTLTYIYEEQIQ